jgi:hypothetical protein
VFNPWSSTNKSLLASTATDAGADPAVPLVVAKMLTTPGINSGVPCGGGAVAALTVTVCGCDVAAAKLESPA